VKPSSSSSTTSSPPKKPSPLNPTKPFPWKLIQKDTTLEDKIRAEHYKSLLSKYPTIPSSFNRTNSFHSSDLTLSNAHSSSSWYLNHLLDERDNSYKSSITKQTELEDDFFTIKDKMWEKTVRYQG
jgi:hypothetical protein